MSEFRLTTTFIYGDGAAAVGLSISVHEVAGADYTLGDTNAAGHIDAKIRDVHQITVSVPDNPLNPLGSYHSVSKDDPLDKPFFSITVTGPNGYSFTLLPMKFNLIPPIIGIPQRLPPTGLPGFALSHFIGGRVLYPPRPGGLDNPVTGATITVSLATSATPIFSGQTNDEGWYQMQSNAGWDNNPTDAIYKAEVSRSGLTASNLPMVYNYAAQQFFPIAVPDNWLPRVDPVNVFFRRKNLSTDLKDDDRRVLSDAIFQFLDQEQLAAFHMQQIDHIYYLFTDHKTFIWQLEQFLLRHNETRRFVPLPLWEPLNDIPAGFFHIVFNLPDFVTNPELTKINPGYNHTSTWMRAAVPEEVTPSNICTSNFATANDLALYIGRSAGSAIGSFHFNAHFTCGGPFLEMRTAAAAVLFWPVHALLVDIYDSWVNCVLPPYNLQTTLGGTIGQDGKTYLSMFTVNRGNEIWICCERNLVNMHDDLHLLHLDPNFNIYGIMERNPPKWTHWTHWEQLIIDCTPVSLRVITRADGKLILLAKDVNDKLCLMPQTDAATPMDLQPESPEALTFSNAFECIDFDLEVTDCTLETDETDATVIVAIKRNTNIVAFGVQSKTGTGPVTWTEVTVDTGNPRTHLQQVAAIKDRYGRMHVIASTEKARLDLPEPCCRKDDGSTVTGASVASAPSALAHGYVLATTDSPGTLFHLDKDAKGEWSVDEQPFSRDPIAKFRLVRNGLGTIFVFGINDCDKGICYKEMPVRMPPQPMRGMGITAAKKGDMAMTAAPLLHAAVEDNWSRIDSSGAAFLDLAVCSDTKGRLEVFALDDSGKVRSTYDSTGKIEWLPWEEIPLLPIMGTRTRAISAALDYTGTVKLFVHAEDNFTYVAEEELHADCERQRWIGWANL